MRVALFITCLTDAFFPRVGEAVVRVLRYHGCEVAFPEAQTCCGQPAYNAGFSGDARSAARHLLEVFAPYEHVVTPSASCAAMVRDKYPLLFADDAGMKETAQAMAAKTDEFTVFLKDKLNVDVGAALRLPETTTWHYPCHARTIYPESVLEGLVTAADGATVAPRRRELCCGFGGLFAIDMPNVSRAMADDRLEDLNGTGARLVVCNEGGCAMQLAGAARRRGDDLRFRHVAELLAESLGLLPVQGGAS